VPQSESAATQERIKRLEEELKRRPDPQLTVKLVELSQLKERVRQLDEANRQDQELIGETYRKYGANADPAARMAIGREVSAIQLRMVRRGEQQRTLREQISKLEAEVGTAVPAAAK
jgi:hypothetical protein